MTTHYSLGSILLKNGLITQSQLNEALQKQQQQAETIGWQLLGEILVESGIIAPQDLKAALDRQAKLIEVEFFGIRAHPATHSLFKRGLDLTGGLLGLSILTAVLPFVALAIYLDSPGPIIVGSPRVGLRGRQFQLWQFRTTQLAKRSRRAKAAIAQGYPLADPTADQPLTRVGRLLRRLSLDSLPQFLNVLHGEMSLVGTRPPTLQEVQHYSSQDWRKLSVKPGLTGLWRLKSHAADRDLESDISYINRWKYQSDLRILSESALHAFRNPRVTQQRLEALRVSAEQNQVGILNVPIDNMSVLELLESLKSGVVLTPNVDHLMKLQRDPDFYKTYTLADYKVCDSQILMYASRFLGTPLKEKISGSDFFPIFCDFHKDNPDITIFLLGGAEGVADRARERINFKSGREIIIGSHSPSFGFEKNEQECQEIVEMINQSGATVLAVGVGAPKQEKWIYKYKHQLPDIKIFLAVGATIDFEAGVLKRAPKWMSAIGMEWLFRIACDPKRLWKRYLLEDLPFFWLLLMQKLGLYSSPFAEVSRRRLRQSRRVKKA